MKLPPEKSILHKDFRYTNAANTDIRASMRRAMKQIEAASKAKANVVTPIRKESK